MNRIIRIAVSAGLLSLIAWRTNWSEVAEKFAHLRVEMWCAAVGFCLLAQIATARRWQLFARELQFEHTLPQYIAYCFIGMFFNLLLPTQFGGDVMRVWYLNGNSGRKWAAVASVFLDRVSGLLILIGVACVGALISPIALPGWIVGSVWGIGACAFLGMAFLPLLQRWQRLPEERRQQLHMLLQLLHCPRILAEANLLSLLTQVGGVVIVWCLGIGLGLEVPFAYYCVLVPLVSLVMLLPVSVNGMGVREGGMVLFLMPLGVDDGTALSLAFLWFTVGAAVSLSGGVVYLCRSYSCKPPASAALSNSVSC